MIPSSIRQLLIDYAGRYETKEFIPADPCFSIHAVEGARNKETIGFLASSISYGARKQFLPVIRSLIDKSKGETYSWVKSGAFRNDIPDSSNCFYRLYTCHDFLALLERLRQMLIDYGSIGEYLLSVREQHLGAMTSAGNGTVPSDKGTLSLGNGMLSGREAIVAVTTYFSATEASKIIPRNASSACKRICMYLRWMVRDNSPVDIGLWSSFIDKRTLVMPLDTHVIQQALHLGLLSSKTTSMNAALRLTKAMRTVFPDDPLRGDFALFGFGVNHS